MKPLRPTHPSATVSVAPTPAVQAFLAAKQSTPSLAPAPPAKAPPPAPQPAMSVREILLGVHELAVEVRALRGNPMSDLEKTQHLHKLGFHKYR